jgi:alkaline phosphatase D
MGWLRRMSAALIVLTAAPTGLSPARPLDAVDREALLVTVAEVRPDRATVWVRSEGVRPVRIRYAPEDGDGEPRAVEMRVLVARDHTARLVLRGLRPRTRYAYEVAAGRHVADGSFVTAPTPDTPASVRLLWSGDLGGGGYCRDVEDGYPIFDVMARLHPDLFLFVGDTVYADRLCGTASHVPGADFIAATVQQFHAKHRYNRADRALQAFFRRTAVFAIWDDHEVRNNFAGPTEPLMPVGRQTFLDYWPIAGPPEEPTRLYRRVRWGRDVEIFILDTRQYRSPNAAHDGPGKTMLGEAQRRWLLEGLVHSDATWKLVVSTVPLGMFTGGTVSDSWSSSNLLGYARNSGTGFVWERDLILGTLRRDGVRNVVFVSGDVHHAEIIRHRLAPDYAVHELVAGPLAARQGYPRFLDRSLGSRSLGSLGLARNFGEILADGESLRVRILDGSGAVRVVHRVSKEVERQREPETAQFATPAGSEPSRR